MSTSKYLELFFEEKEIPYKVWEIIDNAGKNHVIDVEVVIEFVKNLPSDAAAPVVSKLRILDFNNAPVIPFLEHIATFIVNNF